jgi:hypothetical protein
MTRSLGVAWQLRAAEALVGLEAALACLVWLYLLWIGVVWDRGCQNSGNSGWCGQPLDHFGTLIPVLVGWAALCVVLVVVGFTLARHRWSYCAAIALHVAEIPVVLLLALPGLNGDTTTMGLVVALVGGDLVILSLLGDRASRHAVFGS